MCECVYGHFCSHPCILPWGLVSSYGHMQKEDTWPRDRVQWRIQIDISSVSDKEQMLLQWTSLQTQSISCYFKLNIRQQIWEAPAFSYFGCEANAFFGNMQQKTFSQLLTYHFPSVWYMDCVHSCIHTHETYHVSLYQSACHNHFWT